MYCNRYFKEESSNKMTEKYSLKTRGCYFCTLHEYKLKNSPKLTDNTYVSNSNFQFTIIQKYYK